MTYTSRIILLCCSFLLLGVGGFLLINNKILIEQNNDWGPCPYNKTCQETITLYASGFLNTRGDKTTIRLLDPWTVHEIKNLIRESGVLNMECMSELIVDSTREYALYLDGKTQTFKNAPNCEMKLNGVLQYLH